MKKILIIVLTFSFLLGVFSSNVLAAVLSWNAVTTYSDGSLISTSKTITYTMKSGTTSTGPWNIEGTTTTTSGTVGEPTEGTTKYYTVSATVDGVESSNAIAVSKTAPFKTPSIPGGLSIQ